MGLPADFDLFFLGKKNTVYYVKAEINKESINQSRKILLSSQTSTEPPPTHTEWLLILCDELKAVWSFKLGVYTVRGRFVIYRHHLGPRSLSTGEVNMSPCQRSTRMFLCVYVLTEQITNQS